MNSGVKTALIIGAVVVAILVIFALVPGLIGWQGYGYGMMGPSMFGGYGWGWPMAIFGIVILGLVIWGIVALTRGLSRGDSGPAGQSDSALEILKRRYARGEINKEEYEAKKRDLV